MARFHRSGPRQPKLYSMGGMRKFLVAVVFASGFIGILYILSLENRQQPDLAPGVSSDKTTKGLELHEGILSGDAIASKLGNETAKAELGRAAWKLFHTTFARFPDKPTKDEQVALKSYIHLFQRLYPCGECATHFRGILDKFPPQVSSRSAAAAWGCHVHNQVNKSLKKEEFDCSKIGDFYDCGCAEDEEEKKAKDKAEDTKVSTS